MILTIKNKLRITIVMSILVFSAIMILTSVRYERMIFEYEHLTENISIAEDISYLSDLITDEVIDVYSQYTQDNEAATMLGLKDLQMSLDLLGTQIKNNSSLYLMRRIKHTVEEFEINSVVVVSSMKNNNITEASIHRDKVTTYNVVINTLIQDLIDSELTHMQLLRKELNTERNSARWTIVIIFTVFMIFQIILLSRINSGIYNNVGKLMDMFKRIESGELDFEAPIVKEKDEFRLLVKRADEMKSSLHNLQTEKELSKAALVTSIGALAEMRDSETGEHINNIQDFLHLLCMEVRKNTKYTNILTKEYIRSIVQVAPLHDIGKVGIPDNILRKPSRLTHDEFEIMKEHVNKGQSVIHEAKRIYKGNDESYFNLAELVISDHHEKWNGEGYPKGTRGESISLAGRLVALVDVYDALTSDRIYKQAFSHEKAVSIIYEGRGQHFDPDIIDAFIAIEHTFATVKD